MTVVLYAIPASHPCAAIARALELKGLPYRRVELIPGLHRIAQKVRFGKLSVPAVEFDDGERIIGSRAIVRALEHRAPEPRLLPTERSDYVAVARAEEWGDQVLQAVVRRILWAALRRDTSAVMSYAAGAKLPLPAPIARASAPLVALMSQRLNDAGDANVRADLAHLGFHLDRIDDWIGEGALGGERVNAADLQIGAALALLMTVHDVAPLVERRPAALLATRWFADYPGAIPAGTLPRAWLPSA
jgi:glutathione S-transferase